MAWDPEANELYPQSVTLRPPGTVNNYGRRATGTSSVTRAALVEYKLRQLRVLNGETESSSIAVYLSGADGILDITPEWSITLPDGTSRPILSVNRFPDEKGDLHEVVYLQ